MAQNEQIHASISWHAAGSWHGGTVTSLALSPNFDSDKTLLAGTVAGLFLSTDGGTTWQQTDRGLDDPQIITVVMNSSATGIMALAATQSGQLYRAKWDAARNRQEAAIEWQAVTSWAGLGIIQALAISPAYLDDQTIFTATSEGVFRSQDDGQTWESSTFGLIDLDILCLACAPDFATSDLLWAGSAEGGLYRSRNGARSWRDSGVGLPDSPILALHVSPNYHNDQTLYAATENDGLYRSTDGSASWQPFAPRLAGQCINAMASDDTGQHWLVATPETIFISQDSGVTWRESSNQQTATTDLTALTVALANGEALGQAFIGTFLDGVYRSNDGGATWSPHNQGLVAHAAPYTQLTPTTTLFALDVDGLLARYTRTDDRWSTLNHELDEAAVTAIAATTTDMKPLLATTETELFILLDSGRVAAATSLPDTESIVSVIAPSPTIADDQTLFVGTTDGQLWRSADWGATWQALTPPWQESLLIQLACSPFFLRDQQLYAVTATLSTVTVPTADDLITLTLWQSTNGGTDWVAIADLQHESATIAMHLPHDPVEQPVLLAMRNRLIKLSRATRGANATNGNTEWQVEQHHLPEHVRTTGIVTTSTFIEDQRLYLSTTQGVYVGSTLHQQANGAMEWQPAWPEIAEQTVVGLHCTKNGEPLYVVTIGGGLWQAASN